MKAIRRQSGLSKKKRLKALTKAEAGEVIKALRYNEAVFVELEDGQQVKLKPIYPTSLRRRPRL